MRRKSLPLLLLLSTCALADTKLYLKTRVIETSGPHRVRTTKERLASAAIGGPGHVLIQFDHAPDDNDRQLLAERGALITGYVHENGLVVSASDPRALSDLGLQFAAKLEPRDKISPLLDLEAADDAPAPVLIEFHADTDMSTARRAALDLGLALADNPDLLSTHLLASATPDQVRFLADRDEVAYVFRASPEVVSGQPVSACPGALTSQGGTGQYIPKVGDGWDGPGNGSATLGYFFSNATSQLPPDSVRSEIVRAFQEWAKYVQVNFVPGMAADAPKTINVRFGRYYHGDAYPFDGPGGVLAHTFYPAPPNPESIAGDMHFDDDETWRVGADKDLFSVALHEAGHALGLGHSDRPGAVMYPYYTQVAGLSPDDIAAIQELYAAQGSAVSPPASDPSVPRLVPIPSPTPAPAPLAISITPVAPVTTAESVLLTGSVTGGSGAISVSWKSDHGTLGLAQGGTAWSAQVPLSLGSNSITVTATDAQHASVSATVTVTRQPAPMAPPVQIQLTYPAGAPPFTTLEPQITLRGTAWEMSGVQSVRWSSDRGGAGQAVGTANWDTGPIPLQSGVNNITIVATSADSGRGTRVIQVNYGTSGRDTTAPTLTITSPDSPTPVTTADTMVLSGTASDNVGVTQVTWFTSLGFSGTAQGTTNWSTSPIPLAQGYTCIIVRAFDAAGNVSWRMVAVTRQ